MKILQINKFWYRHGGADAYAIDITKGFKERGHDVMLFGMQDERNIKTKYSKFFAHNKQIAQKDYTSKQSLFDKAKRAMSIVYDASAASQLDALLKYETPDIAHLHNIYHHLSPSILGVLKRHKIPTIQTLHDYKRLCPNHAMFTQNKICEQCKSKKYINAIKNSCIFNAKLPSAVVATEMTVQSMFGWYDTYIDRFIAPSKFMKNKHKEWGKDVSNMDVIPYSVEPLESTHQNAYVLYAGRLSSEKGLHIIMHCAKQLPHIPFHIAGDGPLRTELETYVAKNRLKNVVFLGFLSEKKLSNARKKSAFLLIPSQWYENYPIALLEQFAHGKSAIGSDLGGIPEIIDHNKNGYVVEHDNSEAWVKAVDKLWKNPKKINEFGMRALKQVQEINDPDEHYNALLFAYGKAIQSKKS